MIIELKGYSKDKEIGVLTNLLINNGLEIIDGSFTKQGFETEDEVTDEHIKVVSEYFSKEDKPKKLTETDLLKKQIHSVKNRNKLLEDTIVEMVMNLYG